MYFIGGMIVYCLLQKGKYFLVTNNKKTGSMVSASGFADYVA